MQLTDRLIGMAGLFIAVFFTWRTTLIEEPFVSDPVGPRTFPVIICVLLGLASIAMMLRPDPEPHWPALPGIMEVLAGAVVFIGYAELLPVLGFVIATLIGASYIAWRLEATPLHSVIAGFAISVGIYVIFHLILGLTLAEGPLGF